MLYLPNKVKEAVRLTYELISQLPGKQVSRKVLELKVGFKPT